MKLSQFKFKLPEEQIAQYPCAYQYDADGNIVKRVEGFDAHRDECRLMVLHSKSNRIEHKIFKKTSLFLTTLKYSLHLCMATKRKPMLLLKYSCYAN